MASENTLPSAALAPPPVRETPPRRTPLSPVPERAGGNGNGGRNGVPISPQAPKPAPAPTPHRTMPVMENVRVALLGLSANKMRAALTMLGIIIGVAAVIAMIALGQGAREKTLGQIKAMGTNLLLAEPDFARAGAVRGKAASWNRLKVADMEAIQTECPSVAAVSPDRITIRNYDLAMGRFFTMEEEKKKTKVVVLGWGVYQQLYPDGGDPTGKLIRVNNVGVRCIGVLAPKGQTGSFNADDLVVVPSGTAQKRLFNFWQGRPRAFSAQAVSEDKMADAQKEIDDLFRKRYRVKPGDPSTITIRSQSELAQAAEQTENTFTALLAGIAGVSLLVGGIGIMNIMLVSVTERTREIGIRKAIGAKRANILSQFLIEAVTLSILGGLVGIALGISIALALPHFMEDTMTVITLSPILMAFGFSAAVGIFFGFYPAQKASRLDPIVALRYE